jgi:hypothetical protein
MRELVLHLLDIAENSASAQASAVQISIHEDLPADRLQLGVLDNGRGMDRETVARVVDPFVTSRTTRKVGLGIPLLKEAAEACNGSLEIHSTLGLGTDIQVEFQRSHIDRMPLGDVPSTFLTLLVAHPEINWILKYQATLDQIQPALVFIFDDRPVKETLGDCPLTEPDVLTFLCENLEEGIGEIQSQIRATEEADLISAHLKGV